MQTIAVRIEGRSPLLLNRFTDAAQLAASSGSRSSISNDSAAPYEVATAKLYTDEDGQIGVPAPNLYRAFIDAGRFHKIGRSKITTAKNSIVPAALAIEETFLPIEHSQPWRVDTRPVRIPATGGRILSHRPCFDDWQLAFTLFLDEEVIAPRLLREIVDDAGSKIGLGDFRPDTKGPFGRFSVTKWEHQDG